MKNMKRIGLKVITFATFILPRKLWKKFIVKNGVINFLNFAAEKFGGKLEIRNISHYFYTFPFS